MKQVWAQRAVVNVIDSHKEFLDDVTRIASPDFKPTKRDFLLAHVRTTQLVVQNYQIKGITYDMWLTGGQCSEQMKWFDCLDGTPTLVIFLMALSDYNEQLAEECSTNCVAEALELFRSVYKIPSSANTNLALLE